MAIAAQERGSVPFFVSSDAATSSLYKEFTAKEGRQKQIFVQSYELNTYVQKHKIPAVDLIKIDVEGAELDVLEGGLEILERHRPIIICEILPNHTQAFPKIAAILRAARYDHAVITKRGLSFLPMLGPHPHERNFLFWPVEKRSKLQPIVDMQTGFWN